MRIRRHTPRTGDRLLSPDPQNTDPRQREKVFDSMIHVMMR